MDRIKKNCAIIVKLGFESEIYTQIQELFNNAKTDITNLWRKKL